MQVQTTVASGAARSSRYSGFFSSLSTIYREEGLRGWFHGGMLSGCVLDVLLPLLRVWEGRARRCERPPAELLLDPHGRGGGRRAHHGRDHESLLGREDGEWRSATPIIRVRAAPRRCAHPLPAPPRASPRLS
jgi:hypothetical protein